MSSYTARSCVHCVVFQVSRFDDAISTSGVGLPCATYCASAGHAQHGATCSAGPTTLAAGPAMLAAASHAALTAAGHAALAAVGHAVLTGVARSEVSHRSQKWPSPQFVEQLTKLL